MGLHTWLSSIFLISTLVHVIRAKTFNKEPRVCTFQGSVPDPNDCSAYYHCAEGKLYHYNCGKTAAFDPALHTCVSPPTDNNCEKSKQALEQGKNKENDPFICTEEGYFPDPRDCRRFYRCSKHSKHAFSCPVGLGFDSIKITCDPIDSVDNCVFGIKLQADWTTNLPNEYQSQDQQRLSMAKSQEYLSKTTNEHINTNQAPREQHPPSKQLPKQEPITKGKPLRRKSQNGDLFYFWNFDGQTDFDDYISLEEAAKMDYKMPEFIDNSINPQRDNNFQPSGDIFVDFTDRESSSILQNSYPPKAYKHIEPKMGSDNALSGYHVWDLHQKKPIFKDQAIEKDPYWRNGAEQYRSTWEDPPQSYPEEKSLPPAEYTPAADDVYTKQGTAKPRLTLEIAYNSPGMYDYNGGVKPAGKQGDYLSQEPYKPTGGHYAATQPIHRRNRLSSPRFVPFQDTDPFQCPHDGYFRDEGDCSHFYHCSHGLPYLVKCNGGLYFNPANKICDWPARVPGCSDRMRKIFVSARRLRLNDDANVAADKQDVAEAAEDRPENQSTAKEGENDSHTATEIRENPASQAFYNHIPKILHSRDCTDEGYHRDSSDCSVFYHCTSTAQFEYKCEEGRVFHLQLKACVSSEFVDDCPGKDKETIVYAVEGDNMAE